MVDNPIDDEFWTDSLFFESQDPLIQATERKRHPDTGKRISIVQSNVFQVVSKLVVQEAFDGVQKDTRIVRSSNDVFSNS